MTADFFTNVAAQDIWLTKENEGIPIAIAYCAPERMTEGTYNLYLIAIHKEYQGQGIGTELMQYQSS
jgi:ribosomal protein S18 acetylase RimI-like enzyme